MIEEVREHLKKIDQIVDSETRRLNDQIDGMKEELKECKVISSSSEELEDLSMQVDELKYETNKQKKTITKLEHFEKKCIEQDKLIEKLTQEQAGYIFTIQVISKWIPSQKENIDVLVALSSALNHEATFDELQEKTTIPSVTLKNRIIPILEDNQLVSAVKKKVRLTIDNN